MPESENNDDTRVKVALPGAVISPGSPPAQEASLSIAHDQAPPPPPPPQQPLNQAAMAQPQPTALPSAQTPTPPPAPEPSEGFFNPEEDNDQAETGASGPQSVSWTASEFIAHDKSAGWYLGLMVATAILAFFIYILSKDFVSVGVVVVAAIIFGIYGSHKPRQLDYQLDRSGLTIGGKHYGYDQFKSFSVVPEGSVASIVFMPLKRFATPVSIYYPPEEEDKVMSVLAGFLPYEEPRRDTVDSLMKKVRF